jgi:NTE family protein
LTIGNGWLFARVFAVFCLGLAAGLLQAEEEKRPLRVGIALGGGSARGLAHVGVLQWLEEHRVPVDAIAGTSSGAFIGGAYASGMSASQIQTMLRAADWESIVRPDLPYSLKSVRRKEDEDEYPIKLEIGLRHGLRLQSGLNSGHRLGLLLSRLSLPYSTVGRFDDLVIPFRCVATDLESGEVVVLDHGPLDAAMRASMALPGTFDPVRFEGRLLADGGILNNVPADVAKSMGVDVVIAVSVSPPRRDEPPESIQAVANRAIRLMMQDLDRPRLELADVVLLPDVAKVRASAFHDSEAIAARGYQAAEAQASRLLRYALSPQAWEAHQQRLRERRHPHEAPLAFVEVAGTSSAASAQISKRMELNLATPSDPPVADSTKIESDLDWVIGHGRYASAMYRRKARGDKEGLFVDFRDKSYAPPLVKFALDLDNENKEVNLSLGSRITFMDVTSLGSEWRVDTSLGSTLRVATELLQPLGGSGSMRRGAFLAPRGFYERATENFYHDEVLGTVFDRQRLGGGLDAGWLFDRNSQFRVGYESAHVSNHVRVGEPLPPNDGAEQQLHARFDYDGQNRAYFPSAGMRLRSTAIWFTQAPGASGRFGRAQGSVSLARRVAASSHVTLFAEGGGTFGSNAPPTLYQFTLGGPFRLGGFAPNEIRGPKFLLGSVGYRTQLARLSSLLGDRVYLTGLVEAGSAFDRLDGARFKSSFTGGLAADTLFGPLFVGASVGDKGAFRAYFVVGTAIR